ncbi:MAG TPA: UDP-2,3-diacylglucosamine hydrolase [Bacteroidales bacterium]|jgi:UDP-2,3-diacylglucosamine pyrophosphatase LpxH|nr:UDP-2,3-diacylglucosamine hydrolase [Bacteroidales bacterium]
MLFLQSRKKILQEKHYKTIVVSDVHLGTKNSGARQLVRFLKKNSCDTLILNGDIIDGWRLKRSGKWQKKHSRFFRLIINLLDQKKTRIIYIRGNHDDFLDQFIPFTSGKFSIVKDYILESGSMRYYVCHGDIFDLFTSRLGFVAKLGDTVYTFLLWLNRRINRYRIHKGKPYYSFSQAVKHKVKSAVSFISNFENEMCRIARYNMCHGIICGHIHQPANKMIDHIHYMNSGDWVESMTALTEDYQGNWEVYYYIESTPDLSNVVFPEN